MTLDTIKEGQRCVIVSMPDTNIRAQAIRFGIAEGETVTCINIITGGPIIIAKNRQEIAIGRKLAERIFVEPASAVGTVKPFERRRVHGLPRFK